MYVEIFLFMQFMLYYTGHKYLAEIFSAPRSNRRKQNEELLHQWQTIDATSFDCGLNVMILFYIPSWIRSRFSFVVDITAIYRVPTQ